MKPRNPAVIPARQRNSAGPMRDRRKRRAKEGIPVTEGWDAERDVKTPPEPDKL